MAVLIFVSCLPLATLLAGEYPYFSLSAAVYAGNLMAMHLAYRGLWYHATHRDLMKGDIDPVIPKSVRQRFNVFFLLYPDVPARMLAARQLLGIPRQRGR